MDQIHSGSGDNIGRDKIVNIEIKQNNRSIPKLPTKLPPLSVEIIGRDNELKALHEVLHKSSKLVLINGMGGIGKTTTAIAFANRYKDEYAHIVWIEQLGEFAINVASNNVLTTNLDITPSGDPHTDVLFILNKLSNLEGKSLLVIDNADGQLQQFKDDLPKAPEWHVLVTSRQEFPFAEKMTLDFLSDDQALKLFYQYYKWDNNDDIAKHILQTIDYHTLTIEILAKTAQNLEVKSLENVASLLEERGVKIGKPVDFSTIAHSKKERTRYLFPYLEAIFQLPGISESEKYLLKQFIALPPIFFEWEEITTLLKISEDEEVAWDELILARNALKKKGWLLYDENKQTYKMHRIVQDVLKEKLKPTFEDLENLVYSISDLLFVNEAEDNPVDRFPFVNFGEHILQVLLKPRSKYFIVFQSNLATLYRYLGEYDKAKDLHQLALQSSIRNLGVDHPVTAINHSNLGLVYKALGEYDKAKDLLKLALQSDRQNFGEDHPKTAAGRSNLGLVYKDLMEYDKARDLLKLALQSSIRKFGEDHPKTATVRSNLGLVYKDLGEYDKARNLLKLALQSSIRKFGEDHPNTATVRANLGLVYKDLGEYDKARNLLKLALQSSVRNLGEDHPDTATRRTNLGSLYEVLGEYHKTRDLLKLALQSSIRNLGEDHPITTTRRANLGSLYKVLGEYHNARDLYQLALQSVIQSFGENHLDTATIRSNLASVYKDLGEYGKAKELFQKAFDSFRSLLGEQHPKTKTVKKWLDSLE